MKCDLNTNENMLFVTENYYIFLKLLHRDILNSLSTKVT